MKDKKMDAFFLTEVFSEGDVVSFGAADKAVVLDGKKRGDGVAYTLKAMGPTSGNAPRSKGFHFNIRRVEECLFSRRVGKRGIRILGWSIVLRLFWIDIL
jgi:hypothetical protein